MPPLTPRPCMTCGAELPPGSKITRCFCDACRKARRASSDKKRSQSPERKRYNNERQLAYFARNRAAVLARHREQYYRNKIELAAMEESFERGVPLETILEQWKVQ
jgi:hypothetical protein